MKKMAAVLCTALLMNTILGNVSNIEAKNSISKTIKVGAKFVISLSKGKIKYSVNKKNIVSIKKMRKGVYCIIGKKAGSCKITFKMGKKKCICNVKVKAKTKAMVKETAAPEETTAANTNPITSSIPSSMNSGNILATPIPTSPPIEATKKPNPTLTPIKLDRVDLIHYDDTNLPAGQQVVYDLSRERDQNDDIWDSFAPPVVCPYEKFKYSSFCIWLCRAVLQDAAQGGVDYRGKVLNYSVTIKNTGENDLPYLGFALNYTSPSPAYPIIMDVMDRDVCEKRLQTEISDGEIENVDFLMYSKRNERATKFEYPIKAGTVYNYKFHYTIPSDAINGDCDPETGINFPLMLYLENCKEKRLYMAGDEVTIVDCKITVADDEGIEAGVYQVAEASIPYELK